MDEWQAYLESISQAERDKVPEEDFAGPHRSFPIRNAQDVKDAARLIGHADNPDAVKAAIIRIAKRKGLADALPQSWVAEGSGGSMKNCEDPNCDTAECDGDHEPKPMKKKMKEGELPKRSTLPTWDVVNESIPNGLKAIPTEPTLIFAEAEGSTPETPKFRTLVIKEGISHNRVKYPGSVLRESVGRLEGRPIYVDHPAGVRMGDNSRSLASKAGWWSDVSYEEGLALPNGTKVNGIVANLNLLSEGSSPVPWLPGMIKESIERGHPELVGISILAAGKTRIVKENGGLYKEALSIEYYASADAVAEPGAGGQPLSLIANNGVDLDVKTIEEMTLDELKEARPDLYEAMVEAAKKAATPSDPKPSDPKPQDNPEFAKLIEDSTSLKDTLAEMVKGQQILNTSNAIQIRLGRSRLPQSVKTDIMAESSGQILTADEVEALVAKWEKVAISAMAEGEDGRVRPNTIIRYSGLVENTISPLDQADAALSEFFGADVDEKMKGKYPKIRSFSEFYRNITGDYDFNGYYTKHGTLAEYWDKPADEFFAEALPGSTHVIGGATITMSNLLNNVMNKSLFKQYNVQGKWWEPIVSKTELANFKQQQRVRLQNFGSLTERTVDGAEYTELDWGEVSETYTPTGFGNVVTVGRRAIINDDLRGIQRIPSLMAASATFTINEYMANLFTQNSGNGPTLTDTVQVFNAASHQSNRGTAALDRSAVNAGRRVLMKMQNDAGKIIGLSGRAYLLVPIDLETDAYELLNSQRVPESANNAPNILSDGSRGLLGSIVVPQFTDTNNWYLVLSPAEIVGIEMGFVLGQEAPATFVQDQPAVGMVFTNDVMAFKIRHEYGADWLDYRAAYASIVA